SVKRIADEEMGTWLASFTAETKDFEWDEGNRPKLSKHRVTPTRRRKSFAMPTCSPVASPSRRTQSPAGWRSVERRPVGCSPSSSRGEATGCGPSAVGRCAKTRGRSMGKASAQKKSKTRTKRDRQLEEFERRD